jgi:hypothetical protein
MNKKEKIQNEIDKTLGMFEKKESLPPNPYFYTRVQQRLNEKTKKEFSIFNVLKPAFFTALIALNLTTAIWYTSSDSSVISIETDLELVDILKSDLNLESDQTQSLIFE